MKAPKFIWLALLIVTGLTCWHSKPELQTSQVRIKVENDITDRFLDPGLHSSEHPSAYDNYFTEENRMPMVSVLLRESK